MQRACTGAKCAQCSRVDMPIPFKMMSWLEESAREGKRLGKYMLFTTLYSDNE